MLERRCISNGGLSHAEQVFEKRSCCSPVENTATRLGALLEDDGHGVSLSHRPTGGCMTPCIRVAKNGQIGVGVENRSC